MNRKEILEYALITIGAVSLAYVFYDYISGKKTILPPNTTVSTVNQENGQPIVVPQFIYPTQDQLITFTFFAQKVNVKYQVTNYGSSTVDIAVVLSYYDNCGEDVVGTVTLTLPPGEGYTGEFPASPICQFYFGYYGPLTAVVRVFDAQNGQFLAASTVTFYYEYNLI